MQVNEARFEMDKRDKCETDKAHPVNKANDRADKSNKHVVARANKVAKANNADRDNVVRVNSAANRVREAVAKLEAVEDGADSSPNESNRRNTDSDIE